MISAMNESLCKQVILPNTAINRDIPIIDMKRVLANAMKSQLNNPIIVKSNKPFKNLFLFIISPTPLFQIVLVVPDTLFHKLLVELMINPFISSSPTVDVKKWADVKDERQPI